MIARRFRNSSDLRFFPQMHKLVGQICTVVETKQAFVQGKTQDVALVSFTNGERHVWPVSALVLS